MSEQVLDGADVVIIFEQVGGKTVTKGMGGDMFLDLDELDGAFKSFIHCAGGDVMAADLVRSWIRGTLPGGEDILPDPFLMGVRIFTVEGMGQINLTKALVEVLLMESLDAVQVTLEGVLEAVWQNGNAILTPFAIAHQDDLLPKIKVFDT